MKILENVMTFRLAIVIHLFIPVIIIKFIQSFSLLLKLSYSIFPVKMKELCHLSIRFGKYSKISDNI